MSATEEQLRLFDHLLPALSTQARQSGPPTPAEAQDRKRPRKTGAETQATQQRRQGPAQPGGRGRQGDNLHQVVELLSKLVLTHEDSLNTSRLEKGFVLHLSDAPPSGILRQLYTVSEEWHKAREAKTVSETLSLRVVIFGTLVREMVTRLQTLMNSQDAIKKAIEAQIMADPNGLYFQAWNHDTGRLEPKKDQAPLSATMALNLLKEVPSLLSGDVLHKFHATRKLKSDPPEGGKALLEVGLRGETAAKLFDTLKTLQGNAVWFLIGEQLRAADLQRRGYVRRSFNFSWLIAAT